MADKVGKIDHISMENFVTYTKLVFSPAEYLNVIVGPNGTGKSTIVAAIVIGLGGHCKLMSRSLALADYIQNGKPYAKVVVTIHKDSNYGMIRFGRKFDHNKADIFEIDGNKVTRQAFLNRVREFNIQVDNLCQFLPQDRVQDFTRMNNYDLLVNTQASVCEPEMGEWLLMLKERRSLMQKTEMEIQKKKEMLQLTESNAVELNEHVKNVRIRQGMEKELQVCNVRKAWLEYEELFLAHQGLTDDFKIAQKQVTEKENRYNPLQVRAETLTTTKQELQLTITRQREKVAKCSSELEGLENKLEQHEDNVNKQKRDMQDAIGQAGDREEALTESLQVLVGLVNDCKSAKQAVDQSKARVAQLQADERKLQDKNDELMERRDNMNRKIESDITPRIANVQHKIESLENVTQKKLNVLKALSEGAYQAVLWLRSNKHLFQGRIYEPIILELNVPNVENARYLENTIGKRDLVAFTCENTDDMNLFLRIARDEKRLSGVNAIQSDPADHLLFEPAVPIEKLARYGFRMYLIDMVEGPFPVLNALCKLYGLQNVPLGVEQSADHVDALPDAVRLFFTPTDRFAIKVSRYSGDKATCCDQLRSHNLLDKGVDQVQIGKLKQTIKDLKVERDKIRNLRAKIEDELRQTQDRMATVSNDMRKCRDLANVYELSKQKVTRQQTKCEELKHRQIDVDAEKDKFARSVQAIITEMLRVQQKKQTTLEGYADAAVQHETVQEELRIYLEQNRELECELRAANDALQTAKKMFAIIEGKLNEARVKAKQKNEEARAMSQNKTPDKVDFPYREQFAKLPDKLDTLEQHTEEIRARIECLSKANGDAVKDYEACQRNIEGMRNEIVKHDEKLRSLENEMKQLHQQWHPEICQVVQTISETFSGFMESMGFAGEVELVRKEEHDYDHYGIQVRVKYRQAEKLQALDRQAQSGGERAVAIAVYTLALQRLSHVPFRCVDEINQGMDPTNERKIFNMLVDATCRPGQSQYFFVTPKLLPDLKMHPLLSLSIVHNGRSIGNPDIFENHKS